MRIGFGKVDITPRIGVELCGFGFFLNRYAVGVRDALYARALAVEQDGTTVVVVSNDLIGVELSSTTEVRRLVGEATGLPPEAIMVHCTHTHSGPATLAGLNMMGTPDPPYLETLPRRIATACIEAVKNLAPATLSHAEVPCVGIAVNREYDKDAPPLEECLCEEWCPAKPELTDTTCHVLTVHREGELAGFLTYYGCHPVVCSATTRYLHGDWCGVATGMLEREHPGSVGLFLQGAEGDVNSCVVHKPEKEALLALDVLAARYANAVRPGLEQAQPLDVDTVSCQRMEKTFTRRPMSLEEVEAKVAEQEAIIKAPGASDEDGTVRATTAFAQGWRQVREKIQGGLPLEPPTEVQGFRLGPLELLAGPFETFQAIKNDTQAAAQAPIPLVLAMTNDWRGYATDRTCAARGGYAAEMVPLLLGTTPFADAHGELVAAFLELDAALHA
ncbi:MAG: hypothetical protein GX100_01655 [candidate division WS1 bacterium]|nr:hypothetical protein [candidate division WS1 bacterium]